MKQKEKFSIETIVEDDRLSKDLMSQVLGGTIVTGDPNGSCTIACYVDCLGNCMSNACFKFFPVCENYCIQDCGDNCNNYFSV